MPKLSGSCLCGEITFEADGDIAVMANCHCSDCRQATGSAYAALLFVNEDDVEVKGTTKTFEHTADSGSEMTKHFCGTCGSPMFTKNSARVGKIGLRAGTLNETAEFKPAVNVYCSSKLEATLLDQNMKNFDKMPG